MLRKFRIALAAVFYAGLLLVFLDLTGTARTYLDWMTTIQFWPAILALNAGVIAALIVLTLLFGRVYCSVICPLGITQDIISWFSAKRKGKKARFVYRKPLKFLRYAIAVLFVLIFALLSASWASLIEPYSTFGRIVSAILVPLYGWGNNLLDAATAHFNVYLFYPTDVVIPTLGLLLVAVLSFAVIFALAWVGGRTYCNRICPVGTILGALSRWSLYCPQIDLEKCNGCGLCGKKCKGSCIDSANHIIDYSRCVVCMDCISSCNQGAITFKRRTKYSVKDSGRRGMLSALSLLFASTAVASAQKKVQNVGITPLAQRRTHKDITIVPPGAGSVRHFSDHCIACQKCVVACPSHILVPSSDLATFMQPHMVYSAGYCNVDCTVCGDVCPTDAIRHLTFAEKSSTRIGHAVWKRGHCVVLKNHVSCGNCARHCPTGAIQMVKLEPDNPQSLEVPAINKELCIGCGACEHVCPARPGTAIFVKGFEVHNVL